MRARGTALLALALMLLDCEQTPSGQSLRSRYLEVVVLEGASLPCGGELSALDAYYEQLHHAYHLPPPGDDPVTVVIWPLDSADFPCDGGADGCAMSSGLIHSAGYGSVLRHELAHAALSRAGHSGLTFLSEGLAENAALVAAPIEQVQWDPRSYIFSAFGDFHYFDAMLFAAYLLDRFGAPATLQAFDRAREDNLDQVFSEEFGVDFDAVAEDFMDAPKHCAGGQVACQAPEAGVISGDWQWSGVGSCGLPDNAGAAGTPTLAQTLTVVEPGRYRARLDGGSAILMACAPCDQQRFWKLGWDADEAEIELDAGTLYLQLDFDLLRPTTTLTLEYLGPLSP